MFILFKTTQKRYLEADKTMENTFVIDQKSLFSLLTFMQPICTKRTTIDATSAILFQIGHKELILKGTDLEISLQASCDIAESTLAEQQSFLVSGRRIFELVKELDGAITFTLADNQVHFSAGGSVNLTLNLKNPEDFPPFPERIENLMHFEASFLTQLLAKVVFLVPQNNANPALNGLYVELDKNDLTMTATDGHCLAQVKSKKYTLEEGKKWLLPRRAVFELKKLLEALPEKAEVFLGICGNQLVFSGGSFNFFTKLLGDPFPQYETVLNKKSFIPAKADRTALIKTLRRSSCLLSGQFIATRFEFDQKQVTVSLQNKEVGTLKESLLVNGLENELDIRFYSPYLLNGLQVFNEENITFYLNNPSKPIIFEAESSDYLVTYLVMPVSPSNMR